MTERWLPVIGAEGEYEVSDRGNARSLDRWIVSGRRRYWWRGRTLKAVETAIGHTLKKKLYRCVNIHRRTCKVAVLMLEAFVGPKPFPTAVSRHLNDDSLDDRLENLAWGTKQDDCDDKLRNGFNNKGERHGMAKLTEADVLAIRAAYAAGDVTHRKLGEQYGVHQRAIGNIVNRKSWRHI